MGACFSQEYMIADGDFSTRGAPTAKVISPSGQLREYALPITVSRVLETESSASSSSSSALFLCNSDMLCYEELIPAVPSDEELAKDQIYFSLPRSRLGRPLSASDMAALAVKASLALQKAGSSTANIGRSRRGRKSQISPVLEVTSRQEEFTLRKGSNADSLEKKQPPAPPPSARRFRRSSSSRKFKGAVRSFRIRLSTIQEGPDSVH